MSSSPRTLRGGLREAGSMATRELSDDIVDSNRRGTQNMRDLLPMNSQTAKLLGVSAGTLLIGWTMGYLMSSPGAAHPAKTSSAGNPTSVAWPADPAGGENPRET